MTVLSTLTEEEKYLVSILQDRSGIDQMEFMIYDPAYDDGLFRAWGVQVPWWRNQDPLVITQGSRSIGKSLSICASALAFPFCYPGEEMIITAPESVHLQAITDKIETMYRNNRVPSEMLIKGITGIKHKPFLANMRNGARIMGRIPQRSGIGLKGTHPTVLVLDEGQDFPEAGFNEAIETVRQGVDNAQWKVFGVTRGVRDKFYEFTNSEAWTVFRLPAMFRPTWTEEERALKEKQYGGASSQDYRRNILGLHGNSTSSLFTAAALGQVIDTNQSSFYNESEYWNIEITESNVEDIGDILQLIDPPGTHSKYRNFWIGADIGFTIAPTVIVIFSEVSEKGSKEPTLKLLGKITLRRITTMDQVATVLHLMDVYRPHAFAMDSTGVGLPLFEIIQDQAKKHDELLHILDRIKGYNFSQKVVADFDDTLKVDEDDPDKLKKSEIRRSVLEHATDVLRTLVDEKRLQLPWDKELIGEFQGQAVTYSRDALDPYGRKKLYCADLDTEILTKEGWKRYDQLKVGDSAWSYVDVGVAEWTPVTAVNVFDGPEEMRHLSSGAFDALVTSDHKWPVERRRNNYQGTKHWWKYKGLHTTEDLPSSSRHRIPTSGALASYPDSPTYTDEFVQLVGRFMSEGDHKKTEAYSSLMQACDPVTKVPPYDLLHALTKNQLWLFLDAYIKAGGGNPRSKSHSAMDVEFTQSSPERTEYMGMALGLLGIPYSFEDGRTPEGAPCLRLKSSHDLVTNRLRNIAEPYSGKVWCPTTENGTWFARRNNKTYFTGNSAGYFHSLDACRMAVLAYKQHAIEEFLKNQEEVWSPPTTLFL